MEEIELSEQCRLGNNRARKELYEQYAGRMLGICLRYTGDRDTAQDLLHDGFLKIFDSFDKFTWRGEGSLRAWMERVMVNTAKQYYILISYYISTLYNYLIYTKYHSLFKR